MRALSFGLADRPISGVMLVLAVEGAGAAKRARDWQVEPLGESGESRLRLLGPARTAKNGDRPFSHPQHFLQLSHLREPRPYGDRKYPWRVHDFGGLEQHVLGQRDYDRARPPLHGEVICTLNDLGDLRRALDLGRPFGHRSKEGAKVHLLKRAAPQHFAFNLSDEQDHRGGIVLGDVNAVGGVGGARPAGDEANPWPASQSSLGQRHHRGARLLPTYGEFDRRAVHGVERREVGLAGDAIDPLNALGDKLIDEDASAGPER